MAIKFATTALILASGFLASAPSFAGLTTEQVRAELVQPMQSGEYVLGGELGLKLNEISPSLYPAKRGAISVTTPGQVKAELLQAMRSGDITVGGEIGLKLNELYPARYPARQASAGATVNKSPRNSRKPFAPATSVAAVKLPGSATNCTPACIESFEVRAIVWHPAPSGDALTTCAVLP